MTAATFLYRFAVSNLLTLYYAGAVLVLFLWNYIKNPFNDPWAPKLRLMPPANLKDPKYGIHKYIKVNNAKLHYVESGDPSKPLMIFVHGFPEFWYSWRYQITEFNKDYWCIALDMRGYGDSERPEGLAPYLIKEMVEDLRDLVRQLGREKCILISHDWGGLIAAKFRDTYPECLLAVVSLASASKEAWHYELWNDPAQMKKSWYVFLYRMPGIPEKLLQMNNLEIFEKAMIVEGKDSVTQDDIECYKYWFGKALAFTFPINYYRANFTYDLEYPAKCEKKVPFLYALAKDDAYLNSNLTEVMKKFYAHIDTEVVEGCSHFMQQEEPVKVNALIRNFLNKHKV